jgi:thiol-disulfide isomerase/thioredoxin
LTSFSLTGLAQDDPDNHLALGDDMPVFDYQTADGKTLSSEDLWGKVVLINFYASWCGPCKKELPFVEKDIWKKYSDLDNFALLIIARQEDWDKIKGFRESSGLDLPYFPDPKRDIYNLFAEKYIPRNYLFDKQGRLVLHSMGFREDEFEELKNEIKSLLED